MRISVSILATLFVTSCGGGTASAPVPPAIPPPSVDADFGGVWFGLLTNQDQTFEELVGITTSDGRFILISLDTFGPDTVGQYVGMATVDGTDVSGSGSAYAPQGASWSDGSTVSTVTLTAVATEKNMITGSWTNGAGDSVTFDLDYDVEYERASSLSLLEGVWYVYDDLLSPILTLTTDNAGMFTAQAVSGCQSMGQISIINTAYNVYGWDVTISGGNCIIAGDYNGLAVLADIDTGDPNSSQNNVVLVSVSNDQRAILLPLER